MLQVLSGELEEDLEQADRGDAAIIPLDGIEAFFDKTLHVCHFLLSMFPNNGQKDMQTQKQTCSHTIHRHPGPHTYIGCGCE